MPTASANMIATYGSYTHSVENGNAVNLARMEILPRYTDRGKKISALHRLHIHGVLLADNQADIGTKIGQLIDAYAENGQDWILWHSDGSTQSRHRLLQGHAAALSDVQVERRDWPVGDPAEYATGRTFSIIMRQEMADAESEILEYWEEIRYIGTGGYERKFVRFPTLPPIIQNTHVYSGVTMIQRGKVVALDGYPLPYVPASYAPGFLTRTDLNFIKPTLHGKRYTHYGVEWTYTHRLDGYYQFYPSTPDPGT